MELKNKCLFIGLGNCGSKIAKEFAALGYNTMFANGSVQDLKLLGSLQNIYRLNNFDGFGGHRERALDCLQENPEFVEAIQNIKEEIVFVAYGAGGSTGSGLSSIVAEILTEQTNDSGKPVKTVCPIVAIPSSSESIIKHKNAYNAVQEQQEITGIGSSLFISNDSSTDYKWINGTFAKMLNAFLADESCGEINNFDKSEKLEMLREYGAMVLGLGGKDSRDSVLSKTTKTGIFAPIQRDKYCGQIAVVHSGKTADDISIDSVVAEFGKPLNTYEGFGGGGTLIAVSGLTYPNDHIGKLGELAKKAQQERIRNRESSASKLSQLDLELEVQELPTAQKKKPSKLQLLREKQAKMKAL